MRVLNVLLMALLPFMLFNCQESTEHVQEDKLNGRSEKIELRSEYTEIGQVVDGVFEFTVTDDQLQQNFNVNAENNLGVSGELNEAMVVMPNDENGLDTPYFIMRGSLGPEDSAQMTDPAYAFTSPDGVTYIRILRFSEVGWVCTGCPVCVDNIVSQGTPFCKCIWGSGSTTACIKVIPSYTWDFNPSTL
jgi:hypothetical protein